VQQASTFFRQHLNTASIAAFGLAGAVILVASLIGWLRSPFVVDGDSMGLRDRGDYELQLSHDGVTLAGTSERLFGLERWKRDSGEPSGASVNILIVNSFDATSRWMFPDNGQTILSRDELHASDGAFAPVTGLVLAVSNRDGDRQSLYCYRVGGGPAVRFLTADSIVTAQQAGIDRYLAIYRNGGTTTAAVFSLVDFRVLASKPLPDTPQD